MLGKTYTEAIEELADTHLRYVDSSTQDNAVALSKLTAEIMNTFHVPMNIIKLDVEKHIKTKMLLNSSIAARIREQGTH